MRFIFLIINLIYFNNIWAVSLSFPKGYEHKISALIIDNSNGKTLYFHQPDKPKLIASNMKLFTTAVGLLKLKPDFRWHTKLFYTGLIKNGTLIGNLYLKGGGDPTLDDKAIYQIFSALKRLGIKQINGNIIFDETIFTTKPSFSMLETTAYDPDTVLPNGIIINNNLVQFDFNIKNNNIYLSSNLYQYKIDNYLSINSNLQECGDLSKSVQVIIKKSNIQQKDAFENSLQDSVELKGEIAKACNNATLALNLLPNFNYNTMIINRTLADFSINFQGKYIIDKTPVKAKIITNYNSDSLFEVLIRMNRSSDNLIAETVLLSLSINNSNSDSFKTSATIFKNFINKNHLNNPNFKLENGAGLSRNEYFSARNIANLLYITAHSPIQPYFEATLPEPGLEGTLNNRLLQFSGVLHAKTGFLNDVLALSGYFYAPNKHKYIISIIANDINSKNLEQRKTFDNFINNLLSQLK